MSTVETVSPSQNTPRPIWHVFAALAAAVVASIFAGSIQQHGTFAALSNATLLSNLVMGAIGGMLILPGINVAIASIWRSKRNSSSRRNIYFWWGAVVTVLQVLILVLGPSAVYRTQQPESQQPVAKQRTQTDEVTSAIAKSAWKYDHSTNAMTGAVTHTASVPEKNINKFIELVLIASSNGDSRVQIQTYWTYICSDWKQCNVLIRFDNNTAQQYRVNYPDPRTRVAVGTIEDHDRFSANIASASRVRISKDPYVEGAGYLEFDISGLDENEFLNGPS